MPYHRFLLLPLVVFGGLSSCLDDGASSSARTECSVTLRCDGNPDLSIRLKQVETYYFANADDLESRSADLAQFDYNGKDQWIGGVTRRIAESDFDYVITYNNEGRMSRSERTYYDDLGNVADLQIDYAYSAKGQLDNSISSTEIHDIDGNLLKTIDETITYTFSGDQLVDIFFEVQESDSGSSSFRYDIETSQGLVTAILVKDQSSGRPDYEFKSYQYDDQGRVSWSRTQRINGQNEVVEHETITYDYFVDGPLKTKTSIINTSPKQKIITHYRWEAGNCATNQTFGDRLFPTPEVPNFPCL